VTFQWDERKNQENIRKHGFDFADAWEIFELPMFTDIDIGESFETTISCDWVSQTTHRGRYFCSWRR
jgi:uncharacterized DUF497 family protein